MFRFCAFLVVLISLMTAPAYAQESGSVVLMNNGVKGFWFPEPVATKMLKDLSELPLLRQRIVILESRIARTDDLVSLMKDGREVTEQISARWKLSFDEQLKITQAQQVYYEKQLAAEKKWYKSPVLWFGVGVVATAALSIGLNYGLAKGHN